MMFSTFLANQNKSACVLGLSVFVLSACQNGGGVDHVLNTGSVGQSDLVHSIVADARSHAISHRVPSREAFAVLSRLNKNQISVSEYRFDNGVEQIIHLPAKPSVRGENFLKVGLVSAGRPAKKDNILKLENMNVSRLRSEMRKNFPGVKMKINANLPANAYGLFGMAHGQDAAGNKCHYAWQLLDGGVSDSKLTHLFSSKQNKRLSLRSRICDPHLTAGGFENLMKSLELSVPVDALERRKAHQWRSAGSGFQAAGLQSPTSYVVEDYSEFNTESVEQVTPLNNQKLQAAKLNAKTLKRPVKRAKSVRQKNLPQLDKPQLDKPQLNKPQLNKNVTIPSADESAKIAKQAVETVNADAYALVPLAD